MQTEGATLSGGARAVDVLAVMDNAASFLAADGYYVVDIGDARAAVAELMVRANNVAKILSNLIAAGQVDARYGDHVTDLTAALSHMEPQS